MLGYIAKVRDTGRHEVKTFPYAIALDEGSPVFGKETETRHRALFVDDFYAPTKFAYSTLYDAEEVEKWVGRVTLERLAELECRAQMPRHDRVVNSTGRQTCCEFCHKCGSKLRSVLDGELWCDTCQEYK